jgi:hypothetical protein
MADNSRVTPEDFNSNSRLRASDADRDRAASVLNEAMAQGRLTAEEHSDRLDAIYAAKTHADLVPVLDDLPAMSAAVAPVPGPGAVAPAGTGRRLVAVFGGISRKGRWHPDPVTRILTVCGGAELDLREADLPGREITIHAVAVCGGVSITVPPEMRVIDTGSAVMGGREIAGETAESAKPDAPVLRITGTCVCGGVEVTRKPRETTQPRES